MGADVTSLTGERGDLDFEYNGQQIHVIWLPDEYTPEREMEWMTMEAQGVGAALCDFISKIVYDWDVMGHYDEETNTMSQSATETYPCNNLKALAKLPVPFLSALSTAIAMSSRPKEVTREISVDG